MCWPLADRMPNCVQLSTLAIWGKPEGPARCESYPWQVHGQNETQPVPVWLVNWYRYPSWKMAKKMRHSTFAVTRKLNVPDNAGDRT